LLPGPFGSAESKKAFGLLVLEHDAVPAVAAAAKLNPTGPSVAEVLLAYLEHATRHYQKPDGKPSSELAEVKLVCRAIRELYQDLPAAEFTPLKLKAVRQGWLAAGLSRGEINRRTRVARRVFKWAAGEELIPFPVYQALTAVAGLQKGRTTARETTPVGPLPDDVIAATLPHLGRRVRAMVELQRLTGMRPGEACVIRKCDIDMTGRAWVYTPKAHKNAWRGKSRAVAIGPKAQEVLRPFLAEVKSDTDFLFSPRAAVEEFRAARTANRKTPKFESHIAERGQEGEAPEADRDRPLHPDHPRPGDRPGLRQGVH
jgi:integrase